MAHDPWRSEGLMINDHNRPVSVTISTLYSTTATRGSRFLEPRAPLVVLAGMVFRQVWHHQRCDSLHLGGERYKTLQGLRSRFRGNWNMENVTGIWLQFAPWAILKRFKRQPRSENDSHEHESAAWRDMLHRFNPSTSEVFTWTGWKSQDVFYNSDWMWKSVYLP